MGQRLVGDVEAALFWVWFVGGVVLIEYFWGREGVVRWAGRRLGRNASRMG